MRATPRLRLILCICCPLDLVFPGVSLTIFRCFSCDMDFDGDVGFLKADYTLSCVSERYYRWRNFAVLMLFVYPIGMYVRVFIFFSASISCTSTI